jgi:phage gpG-like protein
MDDPRAALRQLGALAVAESMRAFREQSFDGERWPARAPVNVFGIIADFAAGKKSIGKRRFETRPALKDTGTLTRSISFEPISQKVVEIGTSLHYANRHQAGGMVYSERITRTVQEALYEWLQGAGKKHRSRLGWLLNKKYRDTRLEGEVPARPFVGMTDRLRSQVKRAIAGKIMEVD